MSMELTTAALLMAFALLCAGWLARSRGAAASMPGMGPDIEEWRSAAMRHFQEHRDLERAVAEVLATPGAVRGPGRTELFVALGASRVDLYA
ncbi:MULTISPECIES: hypothetical protein [unclassified Nocardioides]|uniref:hypothetical protein n=1 Tax=unclassified Nocardioides TaxID=2615069 RepID=UPI001153A4EE|nr:MULTISPECIES: hypothetical protein [unclassified Nocardioides]TQK72989.1 hypothetical protein FBY23_4810 [Nocardioides sp. SLBN-35]WGY02771.1 hypothetical protein QI633_03210 [Nocardioides sp. QY071]